MRWMRWYGLVGGEEFWWAEMTLCVMYVMWVSISYVCVMLSELLYAKFVRGNVRWYMLSLCEVTWALSIGDVCWYMLSLCDWCVLRLFQVRKCELTWVDFMWGDMWFEFRWGEEALFSVRKCESSLCVVRCIYVGWVDMRWGDVSRVYERWGKFIWSKFIWG